MRRGEVLGLRWSAPDWKAGTLGVTHGVKRVKDRDASSGRRTRLVVSELKTPKSRRTLSLTPDPHELRHSGASLILAQGTPLHVVSEVLGHASIAITKDVSVTPARR